VSKHMTEQQSAHSPTPRPKEATSGPFSGFDLEFETAKLYAEDTWQSGRNSKTLIKYPDYRIVLIALRSGARMPEHQAAGRVSVQTISGRIRIHVAANEFDMPAGQLLVLDRSVPHDVDALEDSAFLLTIAWPEQAGTEASR